jgi:hypothetical protein
MDAWKVRVKRILAQGIPVVRKAWLNVVLLLVAAGMIGLGALVKSQPQWTMRAEIRAYNQGVEAYHLPPGLLPASEERPSEYPIERATAYFEQAASESTDEKLKALVLYNLGTLIAREAYASSLAFSLLDSPRVEMTEAILWLAQAIRLDPSNEDAKYNLEVLDRVQSLEGEEQGAPGPGYSPGAVDKGY